MGDGTKELAQRGREALVAEGHLANQAHERGAFADKVIERLASLPGEASARAAIGVVLSVDYPKEVRLQTVAGLLAIHQPQEVLTALADDEQLPEELRWMIRSEMGLRGMPAHPWVTRRAMERCFQLQGGPKAEPTVYTDVDAGDPFAGTWHLSQSQALADVPEVFEAWPNASVETAIIELADPVADVGTLGPSWWRSLGLWLIPAETDDLIVKSLEPAGALAFLFQRVEAGGCYVSRSHGFKARQEAWSLATALAGDPGAPTAEAPTVVSGCRWLVLSSFEELYLGFGVAALRPEGRELALLFLYDSD